MKHKSLLLLLPLCLFMTGCVWYRLLRTKSHLGDFQHHFTIEENITKSSATGSTGTYSLIFKNPLLSGEDILFITFAPNYRSTTADGELWRYLFEKQGDIQKAPMPISLYFTDDALSKIAFPLSFATLFSPKQLRIMCEALGAASVLKSKRIIDATVPVTQHEIALTRTRLLNILGNPVQRGSEKSGSYFVYRYRLRGKKKQVWVNIYFDAQGRATKMQTHLAGGFLNIFFTY